MKDTAVGIANYLPPASDQHPWRINGMNNTLVFRMMASHWENEMLTGKLLEMKSCRTKPHTNSSDVHRHMCFPRIVTPFSFKL